MNSHSSPFKKGYKSAFIIVVILGASGAAWKFTRPAAVADAAAAETITARVERGTIKQVIATTGRIVSNLDVEIKCKASGEVIKMPYDISDIVKKGDLLLELDPVDEQRQLTQTQVSLRASQARFATAKENLRIAELNLGTEGRRAQAALLVAKARAKDEESKAKRMKDLLDKKLCSQEDYDTAVTTSVQAATELENAHVKIDEIKTQEQALEVKRHDVELAQTEVEMDQIAEKIAMDRISYTKVTAPMDAIVTARNAQIGQIIASGVSNVGGGTTIMTLSDLSRIFVLASVDESDIGKIALGQKASVTVDAFEGKVFDANVVRIASKGTNSSNVVTFEVKLELLGENRHLLKPEMTANIEIATAQKDNVINVPFDSVLRESGRSVVTVVGADGTQKICAVETGISDNLKTEILRGVEENQTVLVYQSESQSRWSDARKKAVSSRMMFGGGGPGGGRR